jgi:putative oxidoreductase
MPDPLRTGVLAFFRIAVSFLFVCHGVASIFGVLGGAVPHGGTIPAGTWPGWYAAVIQVVAGVMVAAGLFTVPAALLASGSMAYAYFVVHQPQALFPLSNHGEAAAMFSLAFLAIAFIGGGRYSLDHLMNTRRGAADRPAENAERLPA